MRCKRPVRVSRVLSSRAVDASRDRTSLLLSLSPAFFAGARSKKIRLGAERAKKTQPALFHRRCIDCRADMTFMARYATLARHSSQVARETIARMTRVSFDSACTLVVILSRVVARLTNGRGKISADRSRHRRARERKENLFVRARSK